MFWCLAFRTCVKKLWLWFVLRWPCAMVQSWYGGWNIRYIPNLHGNHSLCYFRNDCRILKQKNPSEGNDVSSSKKREQQICQQPQWLLPSDKCLFCEKTRITRKQHVENISQMHDNNSWGFCQRSNQKKTRSAHPFEGAKYCWLLEKHITMPPVEEITL